MKQYTYHPTTTDSLHTAPKHVAIIMDGNGRWATARGKSRSEGHEQGVHALIETVKNAPPLGIKQLTVYAFSTENWNRPDEEVNALMTLMSDSIATYIPTLVQERIALKVIGDLDRIPADTREQIKNSIEQTAEGDRMTLIVALNYSGHQEIRNAVCGIAKQVSQGTLTPQEIKDNPAYFEQHLQMSAFLPVDLLIRTGGEQRVSNFLLYSIAYTELFFTPTLWPDFSKQDLEEAVEWFKGRDRRFGAIPSTPK